MLKVVLADDEIRVCRLVQMLTDWDKLEMEVVGTAANGLEALVLIETLHPDILITDIRMPGCDGMELIEKAKQISPLLEIALISGYAEFEYAQAAMRHDVGGYLLKPIKKDTLMATLEKLGKRCKERSTTATLMENLREGSDKSLNALRVRLIEDLINKRTDTTTRKMLTSEYGFDATEELMQVFILKIDYKKNNYRNASIAIVQKRVEETIQVNVLSLCPMSVFHFYGSAGYGIINYEADKRDQIRRTLRQCLSQLDAQKFTLGFVEFTLAVGKAFENSENLPASMKEAQRAIAERLIEGTGRLLEAFSPSPSINTRKLLEKYSRAIEHIVDTLDIDESEKAVKELQNDTLEIPNLHGFELLDLIIMAGKIFATRVNIEDEAAIMSEFIKGCEICGTIEGLFSYLEHFQKQQIEIVRNRRENENIRPIRIAKQYIQQHFSEPITLDDVCAATGFSTSYFSTMFKKESGEGFSKYLSRIRIEHAKSLLQDTNLPVTEICEKVGYSDIKHFTSTFKKTTGLNPGQYRKLYG